MGPVADKPDMVSKASGIRWAQGVLLCLLLVILIAFGWAFHVGLSTSRRVWDVVFSPDARLLAKAGEAGVWVYDCATGKIVAAIDRPAWTVVFSPDSKILAFGDYQGSVMLWELESGSQAPRPPGLRDGENPYCLRRGEGKRELAALAFAPDGTVLASVRGSAVELWDMATGQKRATLKHASEVLAVVFVPNENTVVTRTVVQSDRRDSLNIWDTDAGEVRASIEFPASFNSDIHNIVLSPDGRTLAGSTTVGDVSTWDLSTRRQLCVFECMGLYCFPAFSPDGTVLAYEDPGGLKLVDPASGKEAAYLGPVPEGELAVITFHPDGQTILGAGEERFGETTDHFLYAWDVRSRKLVKLVKRIPVLPPTLVPWRLVGWFVAWLACWVFVAQLAKHAAQRFPANGQSPWYVAHLVTLVAAYIVANGAIILRLEDDGLQAVDSLWMLYPCVASALVCAVVIFVVSWRSHYRREPLFSWISLAGAIFIVLFNGLVFWMMALGTSGLG